jgi:hypothetical protein
MGLQTDTNVERIRRVRDGEGNEVPAANATEQAETNKKLSNGGLGSETYSTGTTDAEQLPAADVMDGGTVLVSPLDGNAGAVYVGGSKAQPHLLDGPGQSYEAEVSDVSEIYIQTPTSGDGVGITWER